MGYPPPIAGRKGKAPAVPERVATEPAQRRQGAGIAAIPIGIKVSTS
jgi:hypothetical protein